MSKALTDLKAISLVGRPHLNRLIGLASAGPSLFHHQQEVHGGRRVNRTRPTWRETTGGRGEGHPELGHAGTLPQECPKTLSTRHPQKRAGCVDHFDMKKSWIDSLKCERFNRLLLDALVSLIAQGAIEPDHARLTGAIGPIDPAE